MTQKKESGDPPWSLRDEAEDKCTRTLERSPALAGKTMEEINHELLVHQIELEIQNEELKKAHRDLEVSRDKYIDLYDFAPVGYFTLTSEALIAEVNLTGASMLGFVRQDLIQGRFRRFILPKEFQEWDHFFLAVLNHGEKQTCELELKQKNGNEFSARIEGIRVDTGDGFFQIHIAISDVTERKQSEILKETNLYHRSLIEASLDPFIIINLDGKISDVNTATEEVTGRSRKDLIDTDFSHSFTEPEKARTLYLSTLEGGKIRDIILEIRHPDGHITPALYNASVYLNENGDSAGVFAVARDITERKRAEDEIVKARDEWERTFNAVPDLISIIDTNFRILRVNQAMADRLGVSMDAAIGLTCYKSVHHTSCPPGICPHQLLLTDGRPHTVDIHEDSLNGDFTLSVTPIFDPFGRVEGSVHILHDITERKRVEQAFKQANKKLNLLSSITRHDIGNQLQIIFGYLEFVQEADLDSQVKSYIDKANESAHNIERQIAFTRDYEDIGVHSPVWQNVSTVISHAVQSLDISPIQLHIEISGIKIFADPLLEKVFYNLVDNAKRYGETITEIRFSGFEGTEGYTIICEDDGVGIPNEVKSKIFNREYFKHTGFGLNLSREILEITGITITETGVPGKGARFEILVPEGKFRRMDNDTTPYS